MTSDLKTDQERFQQDVSSIYTNYKLSDPLQRLRAKYWDHFLALGLPDRKTEVYRYVNLRQLFAKKFQVPAKSQTTREDLLPYLLPECRGSTLVFANGVFEPELSELQNLPKNVLVSSLTDAMKTFGPLLNNQTSQRLQKELDPFASLNGALSASGSFIYISPKMRLTNPIHILQVFDGEVNSSMMAPKIEIFLGAESEATFISTVAQMNGQNYFVNASINFSIEENAHVSLTQSVLGLSAEAWYFEALRASLKRDSSLKAICITDGGQGVRFDYRVDLIGENSECHLNGLCVLKEKKEAHQHILMNHQARDCRSMQFFKGVLDDASHSSFEGKIYVYQEAQKTQAFQLNNNLILSDLATAESKPNLEIFADDVKASHGATVGQLDENQLFYLKTRGLSSAEAKKLLVLGFCNEIIEKIPIFSLLQDITKRIQHTLK
ncbi:hypothetical protein PHSC3_001248 [Chlamydiales bacterium STE3]|nr:hypothetical protein PHSC3_001248 [Chlamydiales bacterium STE3]